MGKTEEKKSHVLPRSFGSLLGLAGLTAAAWILYSRRYIDHHAKVRGLLDAEEGIFASATAGEIHYYADLHGKNKPLLIVHGVHGAAGVHDVVPIFKAYATHRPVYAIDLPGFGGSAKTDRPYRPSLYQIAILDFIKEIIGKPCDIVAVGLSSEFAALAAQDAPEWVRSLVLISPSGFQMPTAGYLVEKPERSKLRDLAYMLLAVPLWSLPLYDLMVNRPRLNAYYQKRFVYRLPDELVSMAYASAHQPGAHFAPMVFFSGRLHSEEIRSRVYEHLSLPVLVLYDNEPGMSFAMLPQTTGSKQNWQAKRIRQSRGMPHFEKPGETFFAMDEFWKAIK